MSRFDVPGGTIGIESTKPEASTPGVSTGGYMEFTADYKGDNGQAMLFTGHQRTMPSDGPQKVALATTIWGPRASDGSAPEGDYLVRLNLTEQTNELLADRQLDPEAILAITQRAVVAVRRLHVPAEAS